MRFDTWIHTYVHVHVHVDVDVDVDVCVCVCACVWVCVYVICHVYHSLCEVFNHTYISTCVDIIIVRSLNPRHFPFKKAKEQLPLITQFEKNAAPSVFHDGTVTSADLFSSNLYTKFAYDLVTQCMLGSLVSNKNNITFLKKGPQIPLFFNEMVGKASSGSFKMDEIPQTIFLHRIGPRGVSCLCAAV